jgi:hypothetical protein
VLYNKIVYVLDNNHNNNNKIRALASLEINKGKSLVSETKLARVVVFAIMMLGILLDVLLILLAVLLLLPQ